MSRDVARTHRMLAPPQSGGLTNAAIAYEAGFADLSHFNRCFRRRHGSTPSGVSWSARVRPEKCEAVFR